MKKQIRSHNKAQSTVVAEALLLIMVVILSSTVVLTLNSNVSYYVQNRELVSIYMWTNKNDTTMNLTAIHSGTDSVKVFGQITFEFDNGTTNNLNANLVYKNETQLVSGNFEVSSFKFGETMKLITDITGMSNGTIHYVLSSRSQILATVDEQI